MTRDGVMYKCDGERHVFDSNVSAWSVDITCPRCLA